jgi:multidrug efflux system outer membrane protein
MRTSFAIISSFLRDGIYLLTLLFLKLLSLKFSIIYSYLLSKFTNTFSRKKSNFSDRTPSIKHLVNKSLIILFLSFSFQSCQLIAPYQAPLTPTPSEWKKETVKSTSCLPKEKEGCLSEENRLAESKRNLNDWWKIFEDPLLNELEEQAINSSYTLWSALERVTQARSIARIDQAALLPSITFSPSYARSGILQPNTVSNLLPSSTQNNALADLPQSFRVVQSQYFLPFYLNYELDIWNKLTNTHNAAIFRAQASAQDYLSVFLTLTTDIASNYFQLRDLDTQLAILEKTIDARKKALEINQLRFKAGLIVYLDVSRAEVELARAQSDLANIQRLRSLQENIIASLIGVPASVFTINSNPVSTVPPIVPYGLPSDLLYRRPDITSAERKLAASYAEIGVAYASFFPSVNLNAGLGLESPFAHSLISWKARLWEIGLNVIQTVFDGGKNCANLDFTKSQFRESLAKYQAQVLMAFQDVEDSLVNLHQKAVQAQILETAIKAAKQTLEISEMRYKKGLINYLDVVDAERTLLATEQNSAIVLGERYIATVRLIKALGGGWKAIDGAEQ